MASKKVVPSVIINFIPFLVSDCFEVPMQYSIICSIRAMNQVKLGLCRFVLVELPSFSFISAVWLRTDETVSCFPCDLLLCEDN